MNGSDSSVLPYVVEMITVETEDVKNRVESRPGAESARESMGVSKVLNGIVCFVEVINDDGIDISAEVEASLTSLGATITKKLGEHATHFITTAPTHRIVDRRNQRILAATLLGMVVVSVQWIQQCRLSGVRVAETGYKVRGPLGVKFNESSDKSSANVNTELCSVESQTDPSLHPTDSAMTTTTTLTTSTTQTAQPLQPTISIPNLAELERAIYEDTDNMLQAIQSIPTTTSSATSGIPMPTYREYIPPIVPPQVLETVAKRRRSERISDLLSETESDTEMVENDITKRTRMESWDYVSDIDVNTMLPIVFVEGRDGDRLPPVSLHRGWSKSSRHSNGSANGSSASNVGKSSSGSGIVGLNMKGKKVNSDGAVVTKSPKEKVFVPVEGIREVQPPVSKVVIAITGFDDSSGDRTTLLQTLQQLIEHIKARNGGGSNVSSSGRGRSKGSKVHDAHGSSTIAPPLIPPLPLPATATSPLLSSPEKRGRGRPPKARASSVGSVGSVGSIGNSGNGDSSDTNGNASSGDSNANTTDSAATTNTTIPIIPTIINTTSTPPSIPVGYTPEEVQRYSIDPLECSVTILSDSESHDYTLGVTHVIVNTMNKTRTLRTLFAQARNVCLLTEEWVNSSVCNEGWAPVQQYLVDRGTRPTITPDTTTTRRSTTPNTPTSVFNNTSICVLDSTDPTSDVLIDLVHAAGGSVYQEGSDVDYVVFGDVGAANEAVRVRLQKKELQYMKKLLALRALAAAGKVVTSKFIFNCIEEGQRRAPLQSRDEVVCIHHLVIHNYHDKTIHDMLVAMHCSVSVSLVEAAEQIALCRGGSSGSGGDSNSGGDVDVGVNANPNTYVSTIGRKKKHHTSTTTTSTMANNTVNSTSTSSAVHTTTTTTNTATDATTDTRTTTTTSAKKKKMSHQMWLLTNEYTNTAHESTNANTDVTTSNASASSSASGGTSSSVSKSNSKANKNTTTTTKPSTTSNPTNSTTTTTNNTTNNTTPYTTAPIIRTRTRTLPTPTSDWYGNMFVKFFGTGIRKSTKTMVARIPEGAVTVDYELLEEMMTMAQNNAESGIDQTNESSVADINNSSSSGSDNNTMEVTNTTTAVITAITNTAEEVSTTTTDENNVETTDNTIAPVRTDTITSDCTSPTSPHSSLHTTHHTTTEAEDGDTGTQHSSVHSSRQSSAHPTPVPNKHSAVYTTSSTANSDGIVDNARVSAAIAGSMEIDIVHDTAHTTTAATPINTNTSTSTSSPSKDVNTDSSLYSDSTAIYTTTVTTSITTCPTTSTTTTVPTTITNTTADIHQNTTNATSVPPASQEEVHEVERSAFTQLAASSLLELCGANSGGGPNKSSGGGAVNNNNTPCDTTKPIPANNSMDTTNSNTTNTTSSNTSTTSTTTSTSSSKNTTSTSNSRTSRGSNVVDSLVTIRANAVYSGGSSTSRGNSVVNSPDLDYHSTNTNGGVRSSVKVNSRDSVFTTNTTSTINATNTSNGTNNTYLSPLHSTLSPATTSHTSHSSSATTSAERTVSYKISLVAPENVKNDPTTTSAHTSSGGGSSGNSSSGTNSVNKRINFAPTTTTVASPQQPLVPIKIVADRGGSSSGSSSVRTSTTGTTVSGSGFIDPYADYGKNKMTTASGGNSTSSSGIIDPYADYYKNKMNTASSGGMKRKSEFIDPYANYNSNKHHTNSTNTSSSSNRGGRGSNILQSHTTKSSIYNATSTAQTSYGVHNATHSSAHNTTHNTTHHTHTPSSTKPIGKNKHSTLLEDDIQTDSGDEREEKGKNSRDQRGRVGGGPPFRQSYPPNSNSNSNSGSRVNSGNSVGGMHSSNGNGVHSAAYRNSTNNTNMNNTITNATNTNSRLATTPHTTVKSSDSVFASGINTGSHMKSTVQTSYRTNTNMYSSSPRSTTSSPFSVNTMSYTHGTSPLTLQGNYPNTSATKSKLHTPRLSSTNLKSLTNTANSIGPTAKGLLTKKGVPVRLTADNLNSSKRGYNGNNGTSDTESEVLDFTQDEVKG